MVGKPLKDWPSCPIDQLKAKTDSALAIGPFGSRMKSDCYVEHGVPVVRGNNISDTKTLRGKFVFISEEKAKELSSCNVYDGDLVFPHRGLIGEVGIVTGGPRTRYVLSTSLMKLTPNREIADPLFLFYFFRSPTGRYELLKNASQVGTPGIATPLASLRSIRVPLPTLPEQRAIAQVLGTLDDKIELNQCVNETLEAMAGTIFKSWFVDFDPVRAKAEGRQPVGMGPRVASLFPASFAESLLGQIPTGWVGGAVTELLSLGRDVIDPGEAPAEVFNHYSIPAFDEGRVPHAQIGGQIKSNKFLVPLNCVLLSKLNPRIPRIWLPAARAEGRAVCSTEFLVALPRLGVPLEFLYSLLGSSSFLDVFATLVTGTSGSHQRVKPEHLLGMVTILPPPDITARFADTVRPMLHDIAANLAESQTLAALRDTFLPKLLSGEVRVNEAEKLVGAAT